MQGTGPPPIPGIPPQSAPPVLILALLSAVFSARTLLVKSCSNSTRTSKLITNAVSFSVIMSCKNAPPTCFSISSTFCWLPLESINIPSVKGKFEFAEKYLITCGLPFSSTSKFSLGRLGINPPFLSLTLKKSCTTSARALNVVTGSSLSPLWVCARSADSRSCLSGTICTSWAGSRRGEVVQIRRTVQTQSKRERRSSSMSPLAPVISGSLNPLRLDAPTLPALASQYAEVGTISHPSREKWQRAWDFTVPGGGI